MAARPDHDRAENCVKIPRKDPPAENSQLRRLKNSWGTFATSERFIKEQPQELAGFVRAVVKGLRVARQEHESTIAAISKFSELDRALSTRMYDDLVGTFSKSGYVDEQTQKNDLAIVAAVADVNEIISPKRL